MLLALSATFVPVSAVADVTNSKGSAYTVETCFVAPDHLATAFAYPDRTIAMTMHEGKVRVAVTGAAEADGGEEEQRFAFGHNFHAILFNLAMWPGSTTVELPYGGRMDILARTNQRPSKLRLNLPGTTPIEIAFSDWRGKAHTPYRMELVHDGVTYDYRYRSIELRCDLD